MTFIKIITLLEKFVLPLIVFKAIKPPLNSSSFSEAEFSYSKVFPHPNIKLIKSLKKPFPSVQSCRSTLLRYV